MSEETTGREVEKAIDELKYPINLREHSTIFFCQIAEIFNKNSRNRQYTNRTKLWTVKTTTKDRKSKGPEPKTNNTTVNTMKSCSNYNYQQRRNKNSQSEYRLGRSTIERIFIFKPLMNRQCVPRTSRFILLCWTCAEPLTL